MEYIFVSVLTLGGIALVSAAVLYFCSRKFAVKSDARVGEIYELLPKANCGGCGLAGCPAIIDASGISYFLLTNEFDATVVRFGNTVFF